MLEPGRSGSNDNRSTGGFGVTAPSISLPKGGGAIRGIGEKFAANPVTGTGSMTVPIATSPGAPASGRSSRCPTTPAPATARSASAGAFRFPRSPQDRQGPAPVSTTPRSRTSSSSPAPKTWCRFWSRQGGSGSLRCCHCARWTTELSHPPLPPAHRGAVRAHRALDQHGRSGDVHWRSISKDNIITLYGKTHREPHRRSRRPGAHLQLADLRDPRRQGQRRRLRATRRRTATASICRRPTSATARRRPAPANRYLKRIRYGNRTPYSPDLIDEPPICASCRRTGCSRSSSTTASTIA